MNYSLPRPLSVLNKDLDALIRSKSDRGAIFIFDNRITRTAYGYHFLRLTSKSPGCSKMFSNILLDYKE